MVDKSGVALFVHGQMTKPVITKEIKKRVVQARRYGHPFIHVHGRGSRNIKVIQGAISELQELGVSGKNIHKDEAFGGIIWVEILL